MSTPSAQPRRISAWASALAVAATLVLAVIPIRVVQLQWAPGPELSQSLASDAASRSALARRGDLTDRRGRLLASTSLGWRAFVDPVQATDPMLLAAHLERLIGVDAVATDRRLAGKLHRRYIPVSGLLEDWQVERLLAADIDGIGLERRAVRHYPADQTASALVGSVGFEHTGLSGLEHALQQPLHPNPGRLQSIRDAKRRTMWIPPDGFTPGRDGDTVRLSIDLVLQQTAETHLNAAVEQYGAAGGRVVMIRPATGELLAVADVSRDSGQAPRRLQRNRCVTDPYEPGSTFKPFIWAAATSDGLADLNEVLPTPSSGPHRTSFGRRIRDSHPKGPSSWQKVLVHSLNSGMAIVAERMSHKRMQDVVASVGFGIPTGCGIPGETGGLVTSPDAWSNYTQTSVSMGHEIAVTPVQMARAFCIFANGGRLPPATIRAIDQPDIALSVQVLTPEVALLARETMELVMSDGTGRRAQSDLYSMFGKSGTAQLPKAQGGGYHEHRYISSFIAAAPAAQPQIVVLCVIDDPDRSLGAWYGGSTAGPVVRDLIDQALPYLGVASDRPLSQTAAATR